MKIKIDILGLALVFQHIIIGIINEYNDIIIKYSFNNDKRDIIIAIWKSEKNLI